MSDRAGNGNHVHMRVVDATASTGAASAAMLKEYRCTESPKDLLEIIDQGIVIFFPAPHSYTGEDVLELQGHGGPAVLQLVLQRCLNLGARLALPGEFTQRAYLNNKLDLAQAESVADLIDVSTM